MKRSCLISLLVAAGLLLAGCSSSNGTAGSSSPVGNSSAASTSSVAAASGSAGTSSAPAPLDAQTTAWFETVCGGLGPSLEGMNALDQTPNPDPAATQQAAVTALQTLQTAFTSTAAALQSAPPPTFAGGAEFASNLTSGLAAAGSQLGPVADKFAAVDPTDTAALKAAATSLQTDLTTALQPMDSINQLDPSVAAAVSALPACQALGS